MSAFVGIDIGNTHITVGLWEGGKWRYEWHLSAKARRTKDEWTILLDGALRRADYKQRKVTAVAISSVVPALTEQLRFAARELGFSPVVIDASLIKSVRIEYHPQQAVGPDRLCGVAAALHRFGAPIIIVDLGTATVIDVVDSTRVYRGGIIAPGVSTAAESLHQTAALLPKVTLEFPKSVVGSNTTQAIQSGILFGSLAMIDGLIERIHAEIGIVQVIATGGFADLLRDKSKTITHVDQQLVLEGIRLLATGEWS